MSVTETNVIDQIGISKEDEINLIISDHLEWGDNTNNHLHTLQEKINSYISFIESEEIFEVYPKSRGKKIKIEIYFKYFPCGDNVEIFLSGVTEILEGINVDSEYVHMGE